MFSIEGNIIPAKIDEDSLETSRIVRKDIIQLQMSLRVKGDKITQVLIGYVCHRIEINYVALLLVNCPLSQYVNSLQ